MKNINDIVPEVTDCTFLDKDSKKQNTDLHEMFFWQRSFGDHCFKKNSITDNEGNILTFNKIYEEFQQGKFGPNNLPNTWLLKFQECMEKELEEAKELLPWKHWSSATIGEEIYPDLPAEERINMLRIELIDIWHFLMSAMMCVGIGPNELHDLYISKNKVNFERQKNGYNTARKNEKDNLDLAKESK